MAQLSLDFIDGATTFNHMVNSAVETNALRVVRSGNEILHDIDLTIATGSVTGLLGPSGCGKTTLLRAVIGSQRIASGTVTVLGRPAGDPSLRTEAGYASQAPSVYADLTVAENLRFFAIAMRAPREDVERVMDLVDLSRYRNQLTGSMSGGQRSRVSLAVALLGSPKLLVLDEPTVGLDPVLREDLWTLFRNLAANGATLLVSSHVMDEADRCDQLVLMRDGRVLTHATPTALKQRTATDSLDDAFLRLITDEAAA
jgi:ABC-2 type transport system ATP-binding protein